MAAGDLTLQLGSLTQVVERFTAYTPRIEIKDQRSSAKHTVNLNSVITKVRGEAKHIWSFTTLDNPDLYLGLSKIYKKQNQLIDAGTFTGITVTDEIDEFVEFAIAPTRQFVGTPVTDPDGSVIYYAKFLTQMDFDFDYVGHLRSCTVTLVELAKLI